MQNKRKAVVGTQMEKGMGYGNEIVLEEKDKAMGMEQKSSSTASEVKINFKWFLLLLKCLQTLLLLNHFWVISDCNKALKYLMNS